MTLAFAATESGLVSSTAASEPTIVAPVAVSDEPPEALEAERAAAPRASARGKAHNASRAHASAAAARRPLRSRDDATDVIRVAEAPDARGAAGIAC